MFGATILECYVSKIKNRGDTYKVFPLFFIYEMMLRNFMTLWWFIGSVPRDFMKWSILI